jgi:hypothetical protein
MPGRKRPTNKLPVDPYAQADAQAAPKPLKPVPPVEGDAIRYDPLNINSRLYRQVATLLDQLEDNEHVTLKERFQALMAIARIQYVFVNLRKEKVADDGTAGSSVRKYASAFKANDPRRGKKAARSTLTAVKSEPEPEPDDNWFEREDDDGDAA